MSSLSTSDLVETSEESYCLLYVPCPDAGTATTLAEVLVSHGLVACANILPGMTSVYEWQGQVQTETEVLLLAKTTVLHQAEILAQVTAAHPYECPCILFLPLTGGNPEFLKWIRTQTDPSRGHLS